MGEGDKDGQHHRRVKHQGDLNLDCLAGLCTEAGIPVGVKLAAQIGRKYRSDRISPWTQPSALRARRSSNGCPGRLA